MTVSFPVYVAAFVSFFGWWFFVFYVGIGMVGLPVSLMNQFRNRPIAMEEDAFRNKKEVLSN